jgi:2-keto-3-deoxy-6-phosphogluconate aldolase
MNASETLAQDHHQVPLIGSGTVLNVQQVVNVHATGGRLVVSPRFNTALVCKALAWGMKVLPGVATRREAFAALGPQALDWVQSCMQRDEARRMCA